MNILQHFASKLCNFTYFKMFPQAVMKDFVFFAQIKTYSIVQTTHSFWRNFLTFLSPIKLLVSGMRAI